MEKETKAPELIDDFQIMTYEKYAESKHRVPYIYTVENGVKKLVYFGARHLNNPSDKMFGEIEQEFNEADPDIVFVEGIRSLRDERRPDTIERYRNKTRHESIEAGEPCFTAKLAIEKNIKVESPEPNFEDEINYLVNKGYAREDIFAYYQYSQANQYYRHNNKQKLDEYLSPNIAYFKELTHWENFDYSIKHLEQIGKTIWGEKQGKLNKVNVSLEKIDPVRWPNRRTQWTKINEIAQNSSYFRDKHIVQKIKEALEKHDRLFIVFGASHAYMQEEAIRKLMRVN